MTTLDTGSNAQEKVQKPASEYLYALLEKTGSWEVFTERSEDRKLLREWTERATFDDFFSMVSRVNGIVRMPRTRIKDRGTAVEAMQVRSMAHIEYVSPSPEDRIQLMQEAYSSARQLILAKRFQDAGLLLYETTQAIHPFPDGNGRTGRVLFMLLSSQSPKDLKGRLAEAADKRFPHDFSNRDGFARFVRNPERVRPVLDKIVAEVTLGQDFFNRYDGIEFRKLYDVYHQPSHFVPELSEKLSPEIVQRLRYMLSEQHDGWYSTGSPHSHHMRDTAIASFLISKGWLEKYRYRSIFTKLSDKLKRTESKQAYLYDGVALLKDLDDGLALELLKESRRVKMLFVRALIDIIMNPEKYPDPNNRGRTLKDFLYAH